MVKKKLETPGNRSGIPLKKNDSIQRLESKKTLSAPVATRDSLKRTSSVPPVAGANALKVDSLTADTLIPDSTNTIPQDTLVATPPPKSWQEDTAFTTVLLAGTKTDNLIFRIDEQRIPPSKEELFYVLTGVVFLLGFTKISFPKYFKNLFPLIFHIISGHKQSKENIIHDPLPSLLLNLIFVFTGGIFLTLIAKQHDWIAFPFWKLLLYATALVALVYFAKFLFISFLGWVFNVKEVATTYIFVVFLVNKILGILLIPISFLAAFSKDATASTVMTISYSLLLLLLLYRYAVSLIIIRRNLNVSPLHFFIYLCAIELVPLMLIYRLIDNQIKSGF